MTGERRPQGHFLRSFVGQGGENYFTCMMLPS